AERRAIANLSRAEKPEHGVERRVLRGHGFLDGCESRRRPDMPGLGCCANRLQFRRPSRETRVENFLNRLVKSRPNSVAPATSCASGKRRSILNNSPSEPGRRKFSPLASYSIARF